MRRFTLGGHGQARRAEPGQPAEAVLGLEDFFRLAGERRGQGHDLVVEGDGLVGVAAVEGLDPDEGGRLQGLPVDRRAGPTGTPFMGTSSAVGRSAIVLTGFPSRSQISIERAKPFIGTL